MYPSIFASTIRLQYQFILSIIDDQIEESLSLQLRSSDIVPLPSISEGNLSSTHATVKRYKLQEFIPLASNIFV